MRQGTRYETRNKVIYRLKLKFQIHAVFWWQESSSILPTSAFFSFFLDGVHTYIHNGKSHRGTPSDLWIVHGFFVRWNLKACGFFPWSRKLASSSSSQIANCNSLTGFSAEEGERRMRKRCFFISCLPPPFETQREKRPLPNKGVAGLV